MPTTHRVRRILDVLARRQPDLTVLAEDVYKPHNLSAILRSCDAVGIGAVHAVRPTGGMPTYAATSASADKWVDLLVHRDVRATIERLSADGMQIVAAHFASDAVDYREVDFVQPTAIVLGNERSGVTATAAALADVRVVIPMMGMVPSLNVSVAAAAVLFEAQRQRREAGSYDLPRLDAKTRNDKAVRWLLPEAAARWDAEGLPYPWIDEHGDVVDDQPSWAVS